MRYWVLNLGMFSPRDWHVEAIEWDKDLRSEAAAAADCAEVWDEDCSDGQVYEVLVAEDQHGRNARRFKVRTRFEVSYDVRKEEDYKIPPPESDD